MRDEKVKVRKMEHTSQCGIILWRGRGAGSRCRNRTRWWAQDFGAICGAHLRHMSNVEMPRR